MDEAVKAVTDDFSMRDSTPYDLLNIIHDIENIYAKCDKILNKAQLPPTGYVPQKEMIDRIYNGVLCLNAYVRYAYRQAYNELDHPLFLGFSKGATETLSQINLNDFTTENSFNMEEHYLVDDTGYMYVYGKRVKKELTMSDFIGLREWEEHEWMPTLENVETVGTFAQLFRWEYQSKASTEPELNRWLEGFLVSGEYDHKAYHPVRDFVSAVADVTIILPLIESIVGRDFITGEDLADWERGIKAAGAIVDLATFGNGAILTNAAKKGVKEFVIAVAKTMAVDALASGATYLTGEMLEELGMPPGTAKIMTAIVSGTVTYAAGKYFFKDELGNVIAEYTGEELDKVLKGEMDDILPEISAVKGNAVDELDDVVKSSKGAVDDAIKGGRDTVKK